MSSTLRDALGNYRNKATVLNITILKLESLGVSPGTTLISVFLVVAGIISYLLIPSFFILKKFGAFVAVLLVILLILLIGFLFLIN